MGFNLENLRVYNKSEWSLISEDKFDAEDLQLIKSGKVRKSTYGTAITEALILL